MGPHETLLFAGEKLGSNDAGPEQYSRTSSSTGISGQFLPVASGDDAQSSSCSSARRNRVYDNIMRQWEKVASSMVPMPRSSHRRVLGGQALPTRQRGESFSLETSGSSVQQSWGKLSDTVSPAVQLAWREQLLRLKLSRLAGVPMTVLLRQQEVRGSDGGAAEACRVVATSRGLSAKLTALAVIEGACLDVSLNSSSSLSKVAAGFDEGIPVSGGGTGGEPAEQLPQPPHHQDTGAVNRKESEEKVVVGDSRAGTKPVSMGRSSSSGGRGRMPAPPLPAQQPVRGFHLVDLHAVVRNSVEWRQCLPKVEPCFRVSSNRDGVLLGLVHALGGRLSCSSAHDIKAGVRAARRASPIPAPPPRLLDRHVCRSPVLLRASVAAGVQLYEVDSADEWRRIMAARRRQELSDEERSTNETIGETVPSPGTTGLGPASVVVRLAMPFRSTRQYPDGSAAASTVADFSEVVEASYGAREEDVVEIVQTAMAATVGPECGMSEERSMPTPSSSRSGVRASSSPLPIAGFSIDVGSACWGDAIDGHPAVVQPFRQRHLDASCATPDAATDATGLAPEEAVPSPSLAESIDAAVAFAVKMAGVAIEAAASPTPTAAAAAAAVVDGKPSGRRREGLKVAGGRSASGSAMTMTTATPCSSTSSPSPFSFRRLHVTGLGEGGARGEPLAALTAALSRHLPPAVATAVTGASSDSNGSGGRGGRSSRPSAPVSSKPVVVSADATEHLMAGGVWSTVASVIGRKSVPPVAVDDGRSPLTQSPSECDVAVGGGSAGGQGAACTGAEAGYPHGEGIDEEASVRGGGGAGGAMYYIDDGCYGSLSGALLRGIQMQPLPLRAAKASLPHPDHDSISSPVMGTAAGGTSPHLSHGGEGGAAPTQEQVPCTVWGPTCDGLDCVCRMTPLPDDMEPGRDWLFFPDVGIRGGADATDFNGLKPLDLFYRIRQRQESAPSPAPAPALSPLIARAVA